MNRQRVKSTGTVEKTDRFIACFLENQQQVQPVSRIRIIYPSVEPDCSQIWEDVPAKHYIPKDNLLNLSVQIVTSAITEPRPSSVGDPFSERSNQYQIGWPGNFLEEIEELRTLKDGWDGGKEIAPSEGILLRALQIINYVSICCDLLGKAPLFPETAPGFRGELGLEYLRNDKSLCVEVSPFLEEPKVLIIAVAKGKNGEVKMTRHHRDELFSVVRWLFEDSNI